MFALSADVRIGLHVVETESDQHFALGLNGLYATPHQMLGVLSCDNRIDVTVLRFIDGASQCSNGARQKRVAIPGSDLLRAIEISNAARDQFVLFDQRQFGTIDKFGFEQAALEGGCCFSFTLSFGTDKSIAPKVTDPKPNQRTLTLIFNADIALANR
ncbi:hypothetical protein AC611_16750 [Xanthomonas phaseoli pv. phaseoli]|nr:hypothetical protein AC609_16705 [Xanthomonas phaseoli pv. phaseoli]AZU27054.1 hypothetical protein AC611_16750 [Xanthomonas phaseoli pv. phaseoli]